MQARHLLNAALVIALALPLSVAALAAVNCCYNYTCPDIPNCGKSISYPAYHRCKRMCSPDCFQGNGCCDFDYQICSYHGEGCTADQDQKITNATASYDKYCRSGGDQVACLLTAYNTCND